MPCFLEATRPLVNLINWQNDNVKELIQPSAIRVPATRLQFRAARFTRRHMSHPYDRDCDDHGGTPRSPGRLPLDVRP